MLPDPHLRVTTAQRDTAVATLREALADERLTLDEFNTRLTHALSATTRRDLYVLLGDLVPSADLPRLIAEPAALSDKPGMRWENPLIISGKGRQVRIGRWEMPPFIEIVAGYWSEIALFCMDAVPLAPVIDIYFSGPGQMLLVVPQGWGVDTHQLTTSGSNALIMSSVASRPAEGNPRIILRGQTTNWVRVRNPKPRDLRRAIRAERRALRHGTRPVLCLEQ